MEGLAPPIPGKLFGREVIGLLIGIGRTVLFYVLLLISMRLLGKRQLGDLELSELVVTVLIADIAVSPIVNPEVGVPTALSQLAVLFGCEWLLSWLSMKNQRLRSLLFGKPSILIRRGKIDQQEMRRNRFTLDELLQELRMQGVLDLAEVEYAILETNGQVCAILRAEDSPVTPKQLGIAAEDDGWPTVVISDGVILHENLRRCGRDEAWLRKTLRAQGQAAPESVFLMTVNDAGAVYVSEKEDL